MKVLLNITLSLVLLVACKKESVSEERGKNLVLDRNIEPLKLTDQSIIDNLVETKRLRAEINFYNYRNVGGLGADGDSNSDSGISCSITIINYSDADIILDNTLFNDYTNYKIVNITTGESLGCLSPTPYTREVLPFLIEAEDSVIFPIQYSAYECFHGSEKEGGSIYYDVHGKFKLFHKLIPNDYCLFLVSSDGVITQEMDMKIENLHK